MIPIVQPINEPANFQAKCAVPGRAWIANNPDAKRPRDLWSPFRIDLATGFADRCGYGAMYIPSGTVDHFVSCNANDLMAYTWSNYRYMDGWLNSSKNKKDSALLLDPFDVRDGWFEILLPSLQLALTDAVPPEFKQKAEYTLTHLPVRDDERLLRTRREWLRMYEEGELTLEGLRKKAPLIADAVVKRNAALMLLQNNN